MLEDDFDDLTQEEWEAAAWEDFAASQDMDGREERVITIRPLDDAPF